MTVRVVKLGTPRMRGEGVRLGTVRRPPRGVPKGRYKSDNWYDVWLPNLAPSETTRKAFQRSASPGRWQAFVRRYRSEMKRPEVVHLLDALAELSHRTNFSVGCYCEDESQCHRSVLREIMAEHGAKMG